MPKPRIASSGNGSKNTSSRSSFERPRFILIAGANGSGKSTFSINLRQQGVDVIDPDELQRVNGLSAIAAGRATIRAASSLIKRRISFSLESTISGHHHVRVIQEARTQGFSVEMVYVGTASVEINLERIRRRVAAGGHDVPTADVRRRAERSLRNAAATADLSDFVIVFDNSGDRLVALTHRAINAIHRHNPSPEWAQPLVAALREQAQHK